VLFPSVPLPLHVFEERYRTMVNRCIDDLSPFGVVYHKGESIMEVGCTALVDEVIKRYDDGRMDILTVGHDRFQIDEVDDTGLYLEATVRYLPERISLDADGLVHSAVDELLKYSFFAELSLERKSLEALTANQLSYLIAGLDTFGLDAKQELLETEDSEERLDRATESLRKANSQLVAEARLRQTLGEEVDLNNLVN